MFNGFSKRNNLNNNRRIRNEAKPHNIWRNVKMYQFCESIPFVFWPLFNKSNELLTHTTYVQYNINTTKHYQIERGRLIYMATPERWGDKNYTSRTKLTRTFNLLIP
jgi:hypothetical protein